jgi:hypothetical protein
VNEVIPNDVREALEEILIWMGWEDFDGEFFVANAKPGASIFGSLNLVRAWLDSVAGPTPTAVV